MTQPNNMLRSVTHAHATQSITLYQHRHFVFGSLCLLCAMCGVTLQIGCQSHQTHEQRVVQVTEHIDNPIRALEARAELESLSPLDPVSDDVIRSMLQSPIQKLSPGSPDFKRAMLEDVAESLEHPSLDGSEPQAELQIDPSRQSQAAKLYTQARTLRQTGQIDQAIALLNQAQRADPASPTIERELGYALLSKNDRVGSTAAFERAFELGDRTPRVLVHLASQSMSKNDSEGAIRLLSLALDDPSIHNEPLVGSIAGVLLGQTEINAGYLKEGATILSEALSNFDANARDLSWKREIIQILNDRASLWILVGDAWTAIGADGRAQRAYATAGESVENPPLDLVARQIAAALKQGKPANASLIFLDHLQKNVVDLGIEEQRWAQTLAELASVNDVLGGAIEELAKRPGLTQSIKRSLLSIELETLDQSDMIRRLGESGELGNDPLLSIKLFQTAQDDSQRFAEAIEILESNPPIASGIGAGLKRTLDNPVELLTQGHKKTSPTQELLLASLGISMGRSDLIPHLSDVVNEPMEERDVYWLSIHAQALSLVGDWDSADRLLDELESRISIESDVQGARILASTLLIAQQPAAAKEIIDQLGDDSNAQIDDLLLASKIAQTLEDYEAAISFLERASQIDPANESIYEQLFTLRSESSPAGDLEELKYIVRQLGTARPRSTLFGLIRANELARNGYLDDAESMLKSLNRDYPHREIGFDLLMSIWKTLSESDLPNALIDGRKWLVEQQDQDPNAVQRLLSIAQVDYELDEHQRALASLEDGYDRLGSFEIARAIEQLLGGPLDQPQQAQEHLLHRLEGFDGVDQTIELCRSLATDANEESVENINRLLESNLPEDIELLPLQISQLTQIVFTLANALDEQQFENQLIELLSIVDAHTESLGFELTRIKLILLAQQPSLNFDEIIALATPSEDEIEDPQQRLTLWALPVQSLLAEDRPHEAAVLLTRLSLADDVMDNDEVVELFRLLGAVGKNSDMIAVLSLLEQSDALGEVVKLARVSLGTPERDKPAESLDEQRADLAYTAAALATAFERDDQAGSYYQLALSYDPLHAWSNNDYGYMLAEEGEQMDLAVELLERAAEALPNEASIIDSLGWVRYKLGIFEDTITPPGVGGGRTIRGAISLLTKAKELDIKQDNATIMLHLGDALWRGGHPQQATEAWLRAEDIARSQLRLINIQPNPSRRAMDALTSELREIRYRIQDADSTGKPQVAPIASENEADTDQK